MSKGRYLVCFLAILSLLAVASTWAGAQKEAAAAGGAQKMTITPPTAKPTKFSEAPMLAAKVKAGEIPPVAQRLPKEPGVAEMLGPVGKYGGTLQTFGLNPGPYSDF